MIWDSFTVGDRDEENSTLLIGVFTGYPKWIVWQNGRFYVQFAGIFRDLKTPVLVHVPDHGFETPEAAMTLSEDDDALVKAYFA